jgi:hypothetical protein
MMPNDDPFANLKPFAMPANVVPLRPAIGMDEVPLPPPEAYEASAQWEPDFPETVAADDTPRTWPTPYDMFDAAALPTRQWIYGRHYLRGFVSVLASAGGIGKTSLQIVEALAIATGKPLLGEEVFDPCNVWLINLEDPIEEMTRTKCAAGSFWMPGANSA